MNAFEYAKKVAKSEGEFFCQYGHGGCAAWDNGPCMDELLTRAEATERAAAVKLGALIFRSHATAVLRGIVLNEMLDASAENATVVYLDRLVSFAGFEDMDVTLRQVLDEIGRRKANG